MGQSGGNQSSSLHRGSSHSHGESFSRTGPPRPSPSSTVTSGMLASASYAQVTAKGAIGPPDQGKRPAEQDMSRDSQVQYLPAEILRGWDVCCFYLLWKIFSQIILLNYLHYTKGKFCKFIANSDLNQNSGYKYITVKNKIKK